jgi:hypothetical protein
MSKDENWRTVWPTNRLSHVGAIPCDCRRAGKHKFPYHQEEIRFFQKLGFLGTINPLTPQIRCTNRWYEDFRSPALVSLSGLLKIRNFCRLKFIYRLTHRAEVVTFMKAQLIMSHVGRNIARHSPNKTVGAFLDSTRSTFRFFGTKLAHGMAHKPSLACRGNSL